MSDLDQAKDPRFTPASAFKNRKIAFSEFDHMQKQVRSKNLIEIFYEQRAVDSYIAENLYGGAGDSSMPVYTE